MNKTLFLSLVAAVSMLAEPTKYAIDSTHSSASFTIRHMMVSNVRGEFSKVTGTVAYDAKNLAASSVEATIDINSINTNEPKRDAHLKSPDFFDVAKFPAMTFKSKSFYKEGGAVKIKGDLTLHGVTKEVVLAVDGPSAEIKDPYGMRRLGATATTKINRKDFGLTWSKTLETGGLVVGDEVNITIDLEATAK